jgi:hypothetical protein
MRLLRSCGGGVCGGDCILCTVCYLPAQLLVAGMSPCISLVVYVSVNQASYCPEITEAIASHASFPRSRF